MEILNVTGGLSGDSFLFKTDKTCILVDTAGQKDAKKLVKNLEFVLNGQNLDYIFLTHSHYDHVGGVAYIKEKYPKTKVVSSEYTKFILEKPTALNAIREMGISGDFVPEYDDNLLKTDITVKDNEVFYANDIKIQTFEAVGHTKCSVVFLINDEILVSNESVGPVSKVGLVECVTLLSFEECLKSIEKCSKIKCKYVIAPHYGIMPNAEDYFKKCTLITIETRDFILNLVKKGLNFEEIMQRFEEKYYTEARTIQLPYKAFLANASAGINSVLKEYNKNS